MISRIANATPSLSQVRAQADSAARAFGFQSRQAVWEVIEKNRLTDPSVLCYFLELRDAESALIVQQ